MPTFAISKHIPNGQFSYLRARVLLLVLLCRVVAVQASHDPKIEESGHDLVYGYQFTTEETEAYWRVRESNKPLSPSRILPDSLQKRSTEAEITCAKANYDHIGANGRVVLRFRYFWVNATCNIPFTSARYKVYCHGEWQDHLGRWTFHDIYRFDGECEGRFFTCVPDIEMGWNGQAIPGPHADVKCVPPQAPNPVWIPANNKLDFTSCGPDLQLPIMIGSKPSHPKPIPATGETYLLSQYIEFYGGGFFRAPKLYVIDKTSKFVKPWRRAEVSNTDITSIEMTLYPGYRPVVKFCVDVAKGLGRGLIMHYGAFPLGTLRRQSGTGHGRWRPPLPDILNAVDHYVGGNNSMAQNEAIHDDAFQPKPEDAIDLEAVKHEESSK